MNFHLKLAVSAGIYQRYEKYSISLSQLKDLIIFQSKRVNMNNLICFWMHSVNKQGNILSFNFPSYLPPPLSLRVIENPSLSLSITSDVTAISRVFIFFSPSNPWNSTLLLLIFMQIITANGQNCLKGYKSSLIEVISNSIWTYLQTC